MLVIRLWRFVLDSELVEALWLDLEESPEFDALVNVRVVLKQPKVVLKFHLPFVPVNFEAEFLREVGQW
ncbi:hypothetical protein U2060_14955, partial [Listeria monocytogenes]|uniref:hypothetical protein n=1 Tax=Listeria monocytogenes TaxID=1639 RepID=UPI002FDC24F1